MQNLFVGCLAKFLKEKVNNLSLNNTKIKFQIQLHKRIVKDIKSQIMILFQLSFCIDVLQMKFILRSCCCLLVHIALLVACKLAYNVYAHWIHEWHYFCVETYKIINWILIHKLLESVDIWSRMRSKNRRKGWNVNTIIQLNMFICMLMGINFHIMWWWDGTLLHYFWYSLDCRPLLWCVHVYGRILLVLQLWLCKTQERMRFMCCYEGKRLMFMQNSKFTLDCELFSHSIQTT